MLHAVNYIHDRGYAHRDLKLQNFFLDEKLSIKLSDFGFCKKVTSGSGLNTICGTKLYMAPEIKEQDLEYSIQSTDIFALGVILYILLTG